MLAKMWQNWNFSQCGCFNSLNTDSPCDLTILHLNIKSKILKANVQVCMAVHSGSIYSNQKAEATKCPPIGI